MWANGGHVYPILIALDMCNGNKVVEMSHLDKKDFIYYNKTLFI